MTSLFGYLSSLVMSVKKKNSSAVGQVTPYLEGALDQSQDSFEAESTWARNFKFHTRE